jgi:hypothetical protein
MLKDGLRQHEKSILGSYIGSDPLEVIERSACNGSWVLISSLRFPSYWRKIVTLLERLRNEDRVLNTFRLFIDLQGFSQIEIPDSFVFKFSVIFHLTSKSNSEQLENLQDIWSTVMDPQVLNHLTEYKPVFPEDAKDRVSFGLLEQMQKGPGLKSFSEILRPTTSPPTQTAGGEPVPNLTGAENGVLQGNLKDQQEKYIPDEMQRELYSEFIKHQRPLVESQMQWRIQEEMKDNDQYIMDLQKENNEEEDDGFSKPSHRSDIP